jgi:hypothetical protein
MLYTIESTLGGFGDVLVEIFALPKACHSGSVGVKYLITDIEKRSLLQRLLPFWQTASPPWWALRAFGGHLF